MFRVRNQIECENCLNEGITGKGISVAIIDTGVEAHPDFDNRIIAFKDFVYNKSLPYDDSSHGTHVCGIIGGNGSLSDGKYRGVAPECNLVVCKVLDKKGDGNVEEMVQAIDWIIQNKAQLGIRVVNISIGTTTDDEIVERKVVEAVNKAWDAGLVVVTAAGNGGPYPNTISAVGASASVITVGCHEGGADIVGAKSCETYSGRGPSKYSDRKPDIVAPGTSIISCNRNVGYGFKGFNHMYLKKSGTYMAAAIV